MRKCINRRRNKEQLIKNIFINSCWTLWSVNNLRLWMPFGYGMWQVWWAKESIHRCYVYGLPPKHSAAGHGQRFWLNWCLVWLNPGVLKFEVLLFTKMKTLLLPLWYKRTVAHKTNVAVKVQVSHSAWSRWLKATSLSSILPLPVSLLTGDPGGLFYSIHIPNISAPERFLKTTYQGRAV